VQLRHQNINDTAAIRFQSVKINQH